MMFYKKQNLSYLEVLELLQRAENSFTPPLSRNIPYSLEEYALRLSENAFFIVCIDNGVVVGFTAFYINIEGHFAYIPQIWVSDEYQRQGIGSSMVEKLIDNVPSDISSIRLEVRKLNHKALSFYLKSDYKMIREEGGKCLMEKFINR